MQNRPRFSAAASLAAVLLLSACNSKPDTVTAGPADPDAATVAAAPPVALPPAIQDSRTYRCNDNSLVYVDFFAGGTTANFRTEKGGTPVALTAPAAGQPLTAEGGYSVGGNAKTTEIASPGKPAQSCKA